MLSKLKKLFNKKGEFAKAKELWESYLSTKPSTMELGYLFYRNNKEELVEIIWDEFATREDIERNQIIEAMISYNVPERIQLKAWNLLKSFGQIEEEEAERLTRRFESNHPISKEIEKTYGKNKEFYFKELEKVL